MMLLDEEDEGHSPPARFARRRMFSDSELKWLPRETQHALFKALKTAFAGLAGDGCTPILDFLTWHSRRENPVLSGDVALRKAMRHVLRGTAPTDEEVEAFWGRTLGDFCVERLIALGGAAIGTAGGRTCIRLTSAGRYLLGLSEDFEYEANDGQAAGVVIVQPNFEVVFTAPAPPAEAAIGRFAERVGHRVGVLFRITRGR